MQTNLYQDIFSYIISQEAAYKLPIQLPGGWNWGMLEHLTTSYLYQHGQLVNGKTEFTPVKNITKPILNLQHRTEDIEVKDVQIYIDSNEKYHLSFLIKKYHDNVFVKENDLDSFFDELNVSRIDYGAGLSKKLNKPRPEVVPLHSIVFCDQTDILSGPIGIKHFFSPDQLLEMAQFGWGDEKNGATATIEQIIMLSREGKQEKQNNAISDTPGKYIEIYEIHGNFPNRFLNKNENETEKFSSQIHIVAFYNKPDGKKGNVILYQNLEKENPFKLVKRDPVYGRAVGFGGAEELFDDQIWVNYGMIRMTEMLDAASKTIMITQDKTLSAKHPSGLKDLDNLEFLEETSNGNTRQLDTYPRNLQLFDRFIAEWEIHAKDMGASQDPLQGKEPVSGTPFASLQAQIQQGMGLHQYRRGQFAKHLEEIYNDWIIPHIIKEITKGTEFMSEFSLEEIQYVSDKMSINAWNKYAVKKILNGETFFDGEKENFMADFKNKLNKKGNKYFIKILKNEFKNTTVKVSIAGKSKNLSEITDKIVNIFRFIFSNPQGFAQVMQIPGMAKSFNQILEYSGLSPADFTGIEKLAEMPQISPVQNTQNLQTTNG